MKQTKFNFDTQIYKNLCGIDEAGLFLYLK